MFIQNTNSNAMLTHGEAIIQSLKLLHNRGLNGKSILSGFSAVLLNFSIAITTKNLSAQQAQLLVKLLDLIKMRLSVDAI